MSPSSKLFRTVDINNDVFLLSLFLLRSITFFFNPFLFLFDRIIFHSLLRAEYSKVLVSKLLTLNMQHAIKIPRSMEFFLINYVHFSSVTSRIWMYIVERLFLAEGSLHTYCAYYFHRFNLLWFSIWIYVFIFSGYFQTPEFSRWLWLNHCKIILSSRLVCLHYYFSLALLEYITVLLHQACKLIL